MQACDKDYTALASAPFGYYDVKKPYKEWPTWARTMLNEPKKEEKK